MKYFLIFSLFLFACMDSMSQVNLNQGLIAYYPFNGNTNDASGSGLNATPFNGVQLTTDRFGNINRAYHFDGIDDYMKVTDNGVLSTPSFSICYYVNTESTTYQNCIGKIQYTTGDGATYNSGIYQPGAASYFATISDLSGCNVQVPGTLVFTMYDGLIQPNEWHCIVNSFDNGIEKLYVDGVMTQNNVPFNQAKFCTNTDFVIGSWWQGDPYRFKGKMDEIRFYNRAINQDEVNALCVLETCNNWLEGTGTGSYVTVGDLDIAGNQLTVEATFNRTAPMDANGSYGFLVSKHTGPPNVNYALWPGGCAITTTNGEVFATETCPFELNKTYHVAMVYDGTSLKFYRNGFLMSQVAQTGNLILNDLPTTIAHNSVPGASILYPFIGFMNEVRIWNVARTQSQLQTYMNTALPNPTTQTGLQGYYTFDDLTNKQGNTAWNGTLSGTAAIDATNPNCSFIADSCNLVAPPTNISNIINDYTPVLALDPCNNSLSVTDASAFNAGDTVLLIQMKGALIDSSNTSSFGTVTNYRNAGNYEFNYVLSKTGNLIKLKNKLTRQYDITDGKVQLIRVPYFTSAEVSANLTCLPWDGAKGGVLAFNVRDTLTMNADIDVSNKGFRGGTAGNAFLCGVADYATSFGLTGGKGEGIAELNAPWNAGGGHLANGGGGSFGGNSGAGGGSNLVAGGIGGREYSLCPGLQSIPGQALTNNGNTKVYMGGGGGGGQFDNGFVVYPGGNGGGMVFISSNHVKGNSFNINANGFSRSEVINDEGGAAGGAGGSVILIANNLINSINVNATGGSGNSNNNITFPNDCHGPGAGGSGGVVFVKQGTVPVNLAVNLTGGTAGLVLNPVSICFNTTHGATNGTNGNPLFNFVMNIDTSLFVPNIDSVRIQENATTCTSFDFHGLGYTNTTPVIQWNWNFGDGNSGTGQDVSHNYLGTGPYTVHLVGTDINGCKDSITIPVSLNALVVNAGNDTAICSNGVVTHTLHGNTTGLGYTWTPGGFLDNNTLQNPTATISATTMFYLNTSGAGGCAAIDSVLITVNPLPVLATINDFSICKLDSMLLTTVSTATTFQWAPPLSVNDPFVSSPYFTDTISQQLIITGTNTATGCLTKDTINVTVKPLPNVLAVPDTSLCGPHPITLTATGAQSYSWSPATGLSNPGIANPVFNGTATQTYTITGTGANACAAKDTITITVNAQPFISTIVNNAICRGDSIQLLTNTDAETIQWTPAIAVSNPTIANPWFHDTLTHQMIVTGTNATGCFVKDTVTITVKPLPNIISIADTAICGPHNVTLNTSGGQSYSWLPATGLSNPNIGSPVFTGTSTQTYTVTGTGANACSAKDTVTITVNTVPLVSATSPFIICRNDILQLTSNSNAEITHWSPALSVNNPNITNPNFTDSVSQQMIVTGTNTSTGCFASDTVDVTVKTLPQVRTIRDTTTCTTNSITLFTTGAQTYSWTPAAGLDDPNNQNPVFTGTGVNTYYVTGTGANGCIAKDTVTVNITNKPVFNAPANKDICINSSVQLDGNNGPDYQYTWSPATGLSNTGIVDPVADPPATTIYSLLIYDQVCNYDSIFTVTVVVHPLPVVTAGKSNDMDCSTPQSQLTASGALHYEWIPGTYLNDATTSNPIASPYVTTHYIVTGTDLNGCVDTDTVTVNVKGSKYFGFAIPNSFTPNGDNLNDCFGVTYWGETKNFHLMIYNRWGEKVFETRNVSECWDGRYKGNPSEIGNYVYYLTGETLCGKVVRKGNLVLFR